MCGSGRTAALLLVPVDGARIRGGTTWAHRGAAIRILFGRDSTEEVLRRDWVMVHEMVHTALPDLNYRYAWLSEGWLSMSSDRAGAGGRPHRAGCLAGDDARHAEGPAAAGDQGLDNTAHWGRQILGRPMFCLLADVEIRKRTDNRLGLQDAMRGVLAAAAITRKTGPIVPARHRDKASASTC